MGAEEDRGDVGARAGAGAWERAAALAALGTPARVAAWLAGRRSCPAPPVGWRATLEERRLWPLVPRSGPAPVLLVRGSAPGPGVAVVGARAADAYGIAVSRRVAQDLVAMGRWVISGGAEGCDSAAHRGALDVGGRTAVVLGSGHDHPYPASNRGLFDEVVAAGGSVISAWWPSTRPAKHRFLFRNRVVAALSEAVVVARAGARSGALSTARAARELGRPVLAVPGDVGAGQSQGPHALLSRGALALTGPGVLARALGVEAPREGWPVRHGGMGAPWSEEAAELERGAPIDAIGRRVLRALSADSALDLDGVAVRTGDAVDALAASLLDLELSGLIERLPGDRFVVVRGELGG